MPCAEFSAIRVTHRFNENGHGKCTAHGGASDICSAGVQNRANMHVQGCQQGYWQGSHTSQPYTGHAISILELTSNIWPSENPTQLVAFGFCLGLVPPFCALDRCNTVTAKMTNICLSGLPGRRIIVMTLLARPSSPILSRHEARTSEIITTESRSGAWESACPPRPCLHIWDCFTKLSRLSC